MQQKGHYTFAVADTLGMLELPLPPWSPVFPPGSPDTEGGSSVPSVGLLLLHFSVIGSASAYLVLTKPWMR